VGAERPRGSAEVGGGGDLLVVDLFAQPRGQLHQHPGAQPREQQRGAGLFSLLEHALDLLGRF
jgi:hypothetical protein